MRTRDFSEHPYDRNDYRMLPPRRYDDQFHGLHGTQHHVPYEGTNRHESYPDHDYFRHRGIRDDYFPPRAGIEYERDPYQRDPYQRSQYPPYASPSPRYESDRRIRHEEMPYRTANSATVRGKLRSCLNKIGVQVNRRFTEYLKPLHTYVMRPEHKLLRPNIMEVTSFVSGVTPALNGSNPLMSQLVSTVIECIEIYRVVDIQPHTPARKRNNSQERPENKKQAPPAPGHYSPRDNSVGTPDTSRNDWTSRSTTSNTSKSRSRDAWNAPSTKKSLDSKDSEKTAITPTTRNGGWNVSTSSSLKSTWNVPTTNHTNMASIQAGPEVNKNHHPTTDTPVSVTFNVPKSKPSPTNKRPHRTEDKEDNNMPKKVKEAPVVPEEEVAIELDTIQNPPSEITETLDSNVSAEDCNDDTYSVDSVLEYVKERNEESDDEEDEDDYESDGSIVLGKFMYEGVTFNPGMDIAPYWLTFIKDRINLKIPIKDLVSFQKCKFILDDEHVFGSDARMKMAMKACDHIVYRYHNKNFRHPKINTDKRRMLEYYSGSGSHKFVLPPRIVSVDGPIIPQEAFQTQFTETVFRQFATALGKSAVFDAGIQFSILRQLETTEFPNDFQEEMTRCTCPCSKMMATWRNKFSLNTLFDPTVPKVGKSSQTLINGSSSFYSLQFGSKHYRLRCHENKTYSPSELYEHCKQQTDYAKQRQGHIQDPFHSMLGLFLEYMYAQEQPRSSMFPLMSTQDACETCVDTTKYTNKKKKLFNVVNSRIGPGNFRISNV